ncbi:hypothetical protein [Actinokineospora sp. NBRC 105648]|uniref:hypothetical protein n=1 Tax=Actinokineospora sp. NBRC 105648 TaxID=3032206 RepID=UPI0024A43628|nr:hypothetical protein [Actinokineospora sp. NBRC 105648]GLZ42848.1 hypothetical protein Acsp05_64720 [Actinokineospora sp. NBRC 105648]
MTSRIELDLPYPGDTLPLGDLERFVDHARRAGAGSATPLIVVGADQDDSMTIGLRIEFESTRQDLIRLLDEIDSNDGDPHAQRRATRELREHLTKSTG